MVKGQSSLDYFLLQVLLFSAIVGGVAILISSFGSDKESIDIAVVEDFIDDVESRAINTFSRDIGSRIRLDVPLSIDLLDVGHPSNPPPEGINSAQALFDIRDDLNGVHFLGSDIDLSGFDNDNNNGNGNWLPVGNSSAPFTGSFDGNGFSITGLNINVTSDYVGLFGRANGAIVSNVSVFGFVNSSGNRVGGLIGNADNSNVSHVSFSGNVGGNWQVGGLIGRTDGGLNVSFSSSSGMVNGTNDNVGGLVGLLSKQSAVSFSSSSSNADSSSGRYVGGLIGHVSQSSNVSDSFASGNVSGSSSLGGLIGHISQNCRVSDSFASGNVSGSSNRVGGLVGSKYGSNTCVNSYWDIDTSGQSGSACGVGKTTSQLQTPTGPTGDVYVNWNTAIWDFGSSSEYPSLILYDATDFAPNNVIDNRLLFVSEFGSFPAQFDFPVFFYFSSDDLVGGGESVFLEPFLDEDTKFLLISLDDICPIASLPDVCSQDTDTFFDSCLCRDPRRCPSTPVSRPDGAFDRDSSDVSWFTSKNRKFNVDTGVVRSFSNDSCALKDFNGDCSITDKDRELYENARKDRGCGT